MNEPLSLIPFIAELGLSTSEQLGEVQARQLIYGGDLELNLLELAVLTEPELLQVLSKATGLPAAKAGYLPVDPVLTSQVRSLDVAALVGFDEAGGYRIFLHESPDRDTAERIRALFGTDVPYFVATQLRMDEGHAHTTGTVVDSRKAAVLKRLGPRPLEEETKRAPDVVILSKSEVPPAEAIHETGPPPQDYEDLAAEARQRKPSTEKTPPRGSASPRNTYSFTEAAADLNSARSRERVIDVLVHFAAQFFDYTAVFAIVGQEAKGLKASGDGSRTADVEKLKIPLDLPSAFREAQATKTHRIGRLRASGLEGGVARDLKRPTGRDMFLFPFLVRGRTVLLLWGDSGRDNVDISSLGELFSFAPLVSETLERVLIERKRASRVAEPLDATGLSRIAEPTDAAGLSRNAESEAEAPVPYPLSAPLSDVPEAPAPQLSPPAPPRMGEVKRRTTQRNSAAPAASLGIPYDAPALDESPASAKPPSTHEEVRAKVRSLARSSPPSDSESEPPASFPAEPPRTIQGFPQAKLPADLASLQINDLPPQRALDVGNKAPLLSRRIVPLESVGSAPKAKTETLKDGAPPPPLVVPAPSELREAPPPPVPLEVKPPERVTMMSRRPPISEPSESDWGSSDAPPVRKIERPASVPPKARNFSEMVHRLISGDDSVLGALEGGGETAVGALIAQFPGPVKEPTSNSSKASDCGPVLGALARMGSTSVPFLTVRTADGDPHVRRWATFLLGELPSKEAAKAIAGRLLDDSPLVRRAALLSARRVSSDVMTRRTLRSHIEALCRDRKLASEARCSAVEALADIREHESIPTLLQLLEEKDRALLRGVRWALSVLTRQNFGENDEAWRKFWQEHRDEDRAEWLISSLTHPDRDIRKASIDELRAMAETDFGFDEEQTDPERRSTQAAFRQWWQTEGKKKS